MAPRPSTAILPALLLALPAGLFAQTSGSATSGDPASDAEVFCLRPAPAPACLLSPLPELSVVARRDPEGRDYGLDYEWGGGVLLNVATRHGLGLAWLFGEGQGRSWSGPALRYRYWMADDAALDLTVARTRLEDGAARTSVDLAFGLRELVGPALATASHEEGLAWGAGVRLGSWAALAAGAAYLLLRLG